MVYGRSGPMSYGLTVHSSVVKVVGSFGCVPVSSCLVWTGVQLQVYRTVRQVYPDRSDGAAVLGTALRYGEVRGARRTGSGSSAFRVRQSAAPRVRVHTYVISVDV